jgi:hypothetical protein
MYKMPKSRVSITGHAPVADRSRRRMPLLLVVAILVITAFILMVGKILLATLNKAHKCRRLSASPLVVKRKGRG